MSPYKQNSSILFYVFLQTVHIWLACHLRAVALWQTTDGPVFAEKSVLQVNDSLSNHIIGPQQVIILDPDVQVLLHWKGGFQLKHPKHEQ